MVLIREAADDETVRGYLPLFQHRSGVWYAITTEPLATAAQAMEYCEDHLQVQTRVAARDFLRLWERIQRVARGRDRLADRPGPGDRVIVCGRELVIAPDGSATIPPWPEGGGESPVICDDNEWMPGFPESVEVDDEFIEVLRRASGEHDMSRGRILDMFASMIEDEPMELLMAVSEVSPEHVTRAAELIVAVLQARGARSSWAREREQRHRPERRPVPRDDPGRAEAEVRPGTAAGLYIAGRFAGMSEAELRELLGTSENPVGEDD